MVTADRTSDGFAALADPTRRRLLRLIAEGQASEGGVCAGDLVARFDISQPAVSKHLRVLREAGLVESEPVGRKRVYRVSEREFKKLGQWVRYFDRLWDTKLDALGEYLDRAHGDGEPNNDDG